MHLIRKILKLKYRTFFIVILTFSPLFSFEQGYDITNLEVLPQYPHPTDEVKITFTVVTYSGANYNYENHAVVGNEINIEACFGITVTSVFLTFIDTISFGILPEGNYHVNFYCYANYATMICDGSPDDTLSKTLDFMVSATNGLETIPENDFRIYPNPSDHFVTIQSDKSVDNITVYNSSGQPILSVPGYSQEELAIDLSIIPAGVYTISIESSETLYFSRFVKM